MPSERSCQDGSRQSRKTGVCPHLPRLPEMPRQLPGMLVFKRYHNAGLLEKTNRTNSAPLASCVNSSTRIGLHAALRNTSH